MKYSWKGRKDINRLENRTKSSGQARLVYVKTIDCNIPTTWRWARGDPVCVAAIPWTHYYYSFPLKYCCFCQHISTRPRTMCFFAETDEKCFGKKKQKKTHTQKKKNPVKCYFSFQCITTSRWKVGTLEKLVPRRLRGDLIHSRSIDLCSPFPSLPLFSIKKERCTKAQARMFIFLCLFS